MALLKQSTAVSIGLGPFVDSTDGFTAETALAIAQDDVQLKKNDGAWAQKHDTGSATHEQSGWYEVSLDTGDTDTLGQLIVSVSDSGALPVWREFLVVPANVYDALVAGLDRLQVDATQLVGDTGAANRIQQAFANGFNDTGVNDRLARILADTDTGLKDEIATLDTGLRGLINAGVLVTRFSDTGINNRLDVIRADTDTGLKDEIATLDTGLRGAIEALAGNLTMIRGDTGAADRLLKLAGSQLKEDGTFDTGTGQTTNTFNIETEVVLDTGTPINVQVDTGAIVDGVWGAQRSAHADTGTFGEHLGGELSASVSVDTGAIANAVWAKDSRTLTAFQFDTGVAHTVWNFTTRILTAFPHDTGVAHAVWNAATRTLTAISDTGLNDRLSRIAADADTGLRSAISAAAYSDTGPTAALLAIKTQTDKLTFDTGNELQVDIRKVNNVTVTGTGDTGAGDTWRPAAE